VRRPERRAKEKSQGEFRGAPASSSGGDEERIRGTEGAPEVGEAASLGRRKGISCRSSINIKNPIWRRDAAPRGVIHRDGLGAQRLFVSTRENRALRG